MTRKLAIIDDDKKFYVGLEKKLEPYFQFQYFKSYKTQHKEQYLDCSAILFDLDYGTPYKFEEGLNKLPDLLRLIEKQVPVLISTGDDNYSTYKQAMNHGASYFLEKGKLDLDEWGRIILKTVDCYNDKLFAPNGRYINKSPELNKWIRKSGLLGKYYTLPILISGEPGSGKTAFIGHLKKSYKSFRNTISFDCSHITEDNIRNLTSYKGSLEYPRRQIFAFNNIEKADISIQQSIFNWLQEALPSNNNDDRYFFTSSEDLTKAVEKGYFLQSLYDIISIIEINVPPLNKRKNDIEPLIDEFLLQPSCSPIVSPFFRKQAIEVFSPDCLEILKNNDWNGNVRCLRSTIQRIVKTAIDYGKEIIEKDCLPNRFSISENNKKKFNTNIHNWPSKKQEANKQLITINDMLAKSEFQDDLLYDNFRKDIKEVEKKVRGIYQKYPDLFFDKTACCKQFNLSAGFSSTIHITLYSHKNEEKTLELLHKHLKLFQNSYPITISHNHDVLAGNLKDEPFMRRLEQTNIFIIFLCPDIIISNEFNDEILDRIETNIENNQPGKKVVPIISRACNWKHIKALSKLESLPKDKEKFPVEQNLREEEISKASKELEKLIISFRKKRQE